MQGDIHTHTFTHPFHLKNNGKKKSSVGNHFALTQLTQLIQDSC